VIRGAAMAELDEKTIKLAEGETITIPRRSRHRIHALESGCILLKISYGKFDEKVIVRLEDDYNRAAIPAKTKISAA
jgi:quercetin dioxygenase-like cupin family protein